MLSAHRGWLSAVIYARLRDHHAVEEVLQETALAASKNGKPSDPSGLNKWLYRVAVRQALLYRRRKARYDKRVKNFVSDLPAARAVRPESDPYAVLVASEQAYMVRVALEKLRPRDCEILLLKYTEHWSCQELATRLGVSSSAIKSRLLRAKKNLREQLLKLDEDWE